MTEHLTVSRHETITHLSIDDGKANALSPRLIADIGAAVSAADADPSTSAVVISGRPGVFSAGFDLEVMRSGDLTAIVGLVSDGGDLVRLLFASSVPVVAACTGHAVAAGALMLLGCDVRVGADGPYQLGLNEVAIGMVLPDWADTIARARLAPTHYQRAVFTARLTAPEEAMAAGFLDRVVPADEVVSAAIAEAEILTGLDRSAYAGSVERFRAATLDRMAREIAADRSTVPG